MKKNKFGVCLSTIWKDGCGFKKQTFFDDEQTKVAQQDAPRGVTPVHLKNGWIVSMYPGTCRVEIEGKYHTIPLAATIKYEADQKQIIDGLRNFFQSDNWVEIIYNYIDSIEQKTKKIK
ncbi:MAG: hypothetical protein EZS26_002269 [Candidatus Ordinivivax streblomastigis]|uniref:Uncharacterized protein n=1 Tax=Candidatus Ordinivivax streblomastigis TaxID=2540710 RepID=A0A5M8NZE7_9BACT|nr:MAG: hypothetical protein EZS26_002269 [Candidatus Ordinivivax streblomastigis]